jgi:hypothetical protein
VDPVAPVSPVAPVDPVAPVGPAGPGTGTAGPGTGIATTGLGVTTVGFSHAVNASAITTAESIIEYFMGIPLDYLTKNAHLNWLAATWSYRLKVRQLRARFRSLAHITPNLRSPVQPMDSSIPAQIYFWSATPESEQEYVERIEYLKAL